MFNDKRVSPKPTQNPFNQHTPLSLVTLLSGKRPDPQLKPLLCDICKKSYGACNQDKGHPFTLS